MSEGLREVPPNAAYFLKLVLDALRVDAHDRVRVHFVMHELQVCHVVPLSYSWEWTEKGMRSRILDMELFKLWELLPSEIKEFEKFELVQSIQNALNAWTPSDRMLCAVSV